VLTANVRRRELKLTLVDGFAGGGRYLDNRTKEERPGSPLIMLEAMRTAAKSANEIRSNPFNLDVEYFFIEEKPEALEYLRNVISESEYKEFVGSRIHLLKGEFTSHVASILEYVKKRGGRSIFVLDQFGYSDVPLATLRQILAELENAEIILTFATDSLIDYLSVDEQTQRILEKVGITLPPKSIESAKSNSDWRRTIQFALHEEIPKRTEARFYTPFFIQSPDAHRDYWLIHLSGHHRARDVMVGLHWEVSTTFSHYGRAGLRMLGYDQDKDEDWTRQKLLPGFFFDQTAQALTQDQLLQQLPERLHGRSHGIAFQDLFAELTNETPATSDIMKEVLNNLARQGILKVADKSGGKRRAGIQHDSDIITPSRQKRFLPP
jgi:three-Cys-motif partner protein